MSEPVVWELDQAAKDASVTGRFLAEHGIADVAELHGRSVADPDWFWDAVVRFLDLPFSKPYTKVSDSSGGVPWTTWFEDGELNLTTACLDRWLPDRAEDIAVIVEHEDGATEEVTFGGLAEHVAAASGALSDAGIVKGDAVAVFLPMGLEAIVSMLAIARIGAMYVPIFSGFNSAAITSRLNDAQVKLLITANGFRRRGRAIEMKSVADEAVVAASSVTRVLVVRHDDGIEVELETDRDRWWADALEAATPIHDTPPTPAEQPFMLAYTSGTTGRPKGVIHVHGGLTVKLVQEGAFQFDLTPGDRLMWLTDMGWIMGPWMVVAGLGNGASIVAFDGAPDFPDPARLWQVVARHEVSAFGVSPTLIRALRAAGDEFATGHDLSALRAFGSTGEPWNEEPWWWLFDTIGERTRPIVNMSGGTEIGACFVAVDTHQGLKPASVGTPCPGIALDVFDDDGASLRDGVGELVCTQPWPGMARGIWGDPDRFIETYFGRWDDVWLHGDWASIDEDGFWFLHGRSDDTLNIAGKRIGPAEIESVAVSGEGVVMAAAVGVPDEVKGEAIVVYVVPTDAASPNLVEEISEAIVTEFGKAFRPKQIITIDDLPRTRSAKIVRRAIRASALGEDPGDLSGLENPEALELIERLEGP